LPGDVRIYAALGSLVLSAWCVFLDNVVNSDGVLYLRAAELLARGEWHAALLLYKWPFYAVLIALVHQLSGLSFEYAAYLLNAALTALTVVMFISLVREAGGDGKVVIFAAAVILLYPALNRYRSFVIRDTGYLAFYLASLLLFVKDMKDPKWTRTLSWIATMAVAALFRIEAVVLLVALPFFHLWRQTTRVSARFVLIGAFIGGAFIALSALAWWLAGTLAMPGPGGLIGAWASMLHVAWQSVSTLAGAKIDLIAGAFGDRYAWEFAYAVFAAALALLLVKAVLATLSPLYAVLTGHAVYRRLIFPVQSVKGLWLWLIVVHLVMLATILFVYGFLTGRFPLALSLTFMLAVPFSVVALYDGWRQGRRWLFVLVCTLALLSTLGVLSSPTSKGHIRQAGLWLRDHTPAATKLFSNDPVLLYYSGKSGSQPHARYAWDDTLALVKSDARFQYDYLALRIKRTHLADQAMLVQSLAREPVATFANAKGEKILVFHLR
jgi:hypothetical protein